ncbi:methyltransferase domain-containing protein [Fibrisoma montanum]|uniref:Methyltransferase domain-containing protein n=1 Tax=Fibrisoma montanum TaxID=2305895 RepID=A0A418LYQ3_9BACT|nr:class I SAM-dependent methyltransferase [Fibrisoma montanum]RIV18503.1 methyltransferase domain-containing protein [Fibrisoma montanum]
MSSSLPQSYFDDIYRASDDPWQFATSDYERDKYQATLAALPNERYANVFEIGCSIGVLSAMLAQRCDRLLAVDASELPLRQARQRLAELPQVSVQQMSIPAQFPDDQFDLILLSEVGYYLTIDDLRRAQQLMHEHLQPGGHLLLVHWTPFVPDYPLTGDQVHEVFLEQTVGAQPMWQHLTGQRAEQYRLDLFSRQ